MQDIKKVFILICAYAFIASPVPCLLYIVGIVGTVENGGSPGEIVKTIPALLVLAVYAVVVQIYKKAEEQKQNRNTKRN